nr:SusC/RagA family TonB-linked outer membrane protein [uncultured Draconibacterium sp.]
MKFIQLEKTRMFYFVLFLLIVPFTVFGQDKKITGTVYDETGVTLPGVTVMVVGTTNGTITDMDGKYTINAKSGDLLKFSYIGFKAQEVQVSEKSKIDVTLLVETIGIDEVVAIGYGTQKKADVTSSLASVKSDDFNKGAMGDAGQLVQGKVAGLQITQASGDPTSTTSVMLRGYSTLLGTTDPLVLVDGVPGSFSTVAPEDIESIDVLKDGSATAIYGTRGTNGVIIITTKAAQRDMPTTIEYSGYVSISNWLDKPDFMDASDLKQRLAEGWTFIGANDKDYGSETDWLDEISQTGVTHVHNVSLKGGSEATSLIANLTYDSKEGTIKKSGADNMRAHIQVKHAMFDDKLISNVSIIASERNTDMPNNWNYIYRLASVQNPTQAVYDENGDYVERSIYNYDNPVSYLNERIGMSRSRNLRFTGSLEFHPVESVVLKGMFTRKGNSYLSGYYYTKNDVTTTESGYNGYASRYTSDNITDLVELTADWKKSFGDHRISAIVGYNYEDYTSENFGANNRDFPTDNYSYNKLEMGLGISDGLGGVSSYKYNTKLIGLFARATYNYDDRYLFMVSLRHEGSSKFGADNKWGNFPGVSAGWRMSNEEFMKPVTWLDNLKVRAGFGITGTDVSNPYESLMSYDYSGYFLYNGEWTQTLAPVRNSNPDLRWEKKYEYNFGIDFSVLKGRIGGSIDMYQRDTKDGLYYYSVPVPPYQYGTIMANVCHIRNKGLELLVNAVPVKTQNFQWNTNITYSKNSNKLISLQNDQFSMGQNYFDTGHTGEPIQTTTHRVQEGAAIGNFFGLRSVGVNSAGLWVVERLNRDAEGNVTDKYYDLAGNAGPEDWQVLGNGVPSVNMSWNNQFSYKNFDLSIAMRGAFDFQILNFQKMYYAVTSDVQYNVLNSAFDKIDVVDVATGQKTGEQTTNGDSQRYVSHYIEDGDYWKISNLTLGYNFDVKSVEWLNRLRVYASVNNLATITGYSGLDPEVRNTYSVIDNAINYDPGTDHRDKYPTTRSYTFGVNVTF